MKRRIGGTPQWPSRGKRTATVVVVGAKQSKPADKQPDSQYHLHDEHGHAWYLDYDWEAWLLVAGVFVFLFFLIIVVILQAALWPIPSDDDDDDDGLDDDLMVRGMPDGWWEANAEFRHRYQEARKQILDAKNADCPRGMHAWLPDRIRHFTQGQPDDGMPRAQDAMCMVNFFAPHAPDATLFPDVRAPSSSRARRNATGDRVACAPFAYEMFACANWYADFDADSAVANPAGADPVKDLERAFHVSRGFSQLSVMNKKLLGEVVHMVSTYSPMGWSQDGVHSVLGGDHEEGYFRRLMHACINSTAVDGKFSRVDLPPDIHLFWDTASELAAPMAPESHQSWEERVRAVGAAFGRAQCLGVAPIVRVQASAHFTNRSLPVLMVEPQLPLLSASPHKDETDLMALYCNVAASVPGFSAECPQDSSASNCSRDWCIRRMSAFSSAVHGFIADQQRRATRHRAQQFFQTPFWTGFVSGMRDPAPLGLRSAAGPGDYRGCLDPAAAEAILDLDTEGNDESLWLVPEDMMPESTSLFRFYASAFFWDEGGVRPPYADMVRDVRTWKTLLYVGLAADYLEHTDHDRLSSYIVPLYEKMYGPAEEATRAVDAKALMRQEFDRHITPWMQGHVKAMRHRKGRRDPAGPVSLSWASRNLRKMAMLGMHGRFEYGNERAMPSSLRMLDPERGQLERQEDSGKWPACAMLAATYLPSVVDDAFASAALSGSDVERVTQVTQRVIRQLVESIRSSRLLSADAKEKLIAKAQDIAIRVAVPWGIQQGGDARAPPSHDAMGILGDSLWQDVCSIRRYSTRNNLNSAFGPASSPRDRRDRIMYQNGGVDHFGMSTAEANAYYSPVQNSINILAGIMAPPFYHPTYAMPSLLGGIGAVVGHELSHAFDSSGIMFDPLGSYASSATWLSADDMDAYRRREACFVQRYNVTTRLGNRIDSESTLGENIADTMGVRAALDALVEYAREQAPPVAEEEEEARAVSKVRRKRGHASRRGAADAPPLKRDVALDPDSLREFIETYAQLWCVNQSPESELETIESNPHSPGGTRINGAVSSLFFSQAHGDGDPLAVAYGCTPRQQQSKKKNGVGLSDGPCTLW